jgi:hypothetical protein
MNRPSSKKYHELPASYMIPFINVRLFLYDTDESKLVNGTDVICRHPHPMHRFPRPSTNSGHSFQTLLATTAFSLKNWI